MAAPPAIRQATPLAAPESAFAPERLDSHLDKVLEATDQFLASVLKLQPAVEKAIVKLGEAPWPKNADLTQREIHLDRHVQIYRNAARAGLDLSKALETLTETRRRVSGAADKTVVLMHDRSDRELFALVLAFQGKAPPSRDDG
jgi:hypothetical protein